MRKGKKGKGWRLGCYFSEQVFRHAFSVQHYILNTNKPKILFTEKQGSKTPLK